VVPEKFNTRVADLLALMTKSAKTPTEMQALGVKRQAELRALYTMLIKPVEQYLPQNKDEVITIIPHDVLFRIPFAALMADNGDYLIERHTLSYAPAIGVLRATQKLQQQSQGGSHNLLAFGNPITERIAFLGALPYSEKEVKSIAQIFGATNSTTEIGAAATKAKFNDLAPNASEIHLATHGLVDEEHPMKSALVLAPTDKDDGMLSVRDILTMKNLKARIVVLSACQTGRGKITGDGVVGLSRAFIIAGAPSVLVSQWNVDDIMTAYQMERFYKFYLKGSDRARALRDAQLATINYMEDAPAGTVVAHSPGKVRANPRYWAAFQLIGEI
jgi:CHAT domain-containing protein